MSRPPTYHCGSPGARTLAVALAVAGCLAIAPPTLAEPVAQPNVILIVLDDLGYGDPGIYGGTEIQMPNIDALATEGMHFTQHYALSPVCSPARVALFTGRYPSALGIRSVLDPGGDTPSARGIPAQIPTLADALSAAGYVTGHVGKWHMGLAHPEYTPETRFDSWVRAPEKTYYDPVVQVDDQPGIQVEGHRTTILTDHAIDFVQAHQDEPFFLNLWYHAPHAPLEPPLEWLLQYPNNKEGWYKALVSHADEQIGRLLDELETLELEESTLVILTSDHGTTNGSTGPFKGNKTTLWEGGLRVPLIVRWTGAVPAGTQNTSVSAHIDWFATLVDYLGIEDPELDLHGVSLVDAILQNQTLEREGPLYFDFEHRFAVRDGDYKIHQRTNVTDPSPAFAPMLVDLASDVGETTNLASTDVPRVEALTQGYLDWRMEMGPIPHQVGAVEGQASVSGRHLGFDGGRVVLEDDRRFDFHEGDFSFRADVTPASIGGPQMIAENPGVWELELQENGLLRLALPNPAGDDTTLFSQTTLAAGNTYEVAFTNLAFRNGPQTRRLFVDGVVEDEVEETRLPDYATAAVLLGNDADSGRPFEGTLDSPLFYTMSLYVSELPEPGAGPLGFAALCSLAAIARRFRRAAR